MAIRNIIENGDEILRKKSREVEEINERILELLDDMVETLHKSNGVGLSAVQVGVLKRVVVIDIYDGKGPIKLINPKITKTKGEVELEEGCLSFPNQYAKVKRAEEVTVEALNEKGKKIKITAKELLAQTLQHELDHLEGVLFVDRMIPGTMEYVDPDNNQPVKE
jgi:peptide deformylase